MFGIKLDMYTLVVVGLCLFIVYYLFFSKPTSVSRDYEVDMTKTDGEKMIVYLHMEKCPHCVKFTPEWLKFVKESPVKTDMVESKDIKGSPYEHLPVKGFPTVMLLINGEPVAELEDRSVKGLHELASK